MKDEGKAEQLIALLLWKISSRDWINQPYAFSDYCERIQCDAEFREEQYQYYRQEYNLSVSEK